VVRFITGKPLASGRIGVLPSAFNPVTRAHLALADGAASAAGLDQVVFLLPEHLPHKRFEGATFGDRLDMLRAAIGDRMERPVAVSSGGLFIEIAREFREACGPSASISLICGSDAAARIACWDYPGYPPFERQLDEFRLLVALRGEAFETPEALCGRIVTFSLAEEFSRISSSLLREAAAAGREWQWMTAPAVARLIESRGLYGAARG
jgi:nicotinic acid mononucleotide adenylyltransferase